MEIKIRSFNFFVASFNGFLGGARVFYIQVKKSRGNFNFMNYFLYQIKKYFTDFNPP